MPHVVYLLQIFTIKRQSFQKNQNEKKIRRLFFSLIKLITFFKHIFSKRITGKWEENCPISASNSEKQCRHTNIYSNM